MEELNFPQAVQELDAIIGELRAKNPQRKVAVMGFCMGGALALAISALSKNRVDAVRVIPKKLVVKILATRSFPFTACPQRPSQICRRSRAPSRATTVPLTTLSPLPASRSSRSASRRPASPTRSSCTSPFVIFFFPPKLFTY